MFRLQFWGFFFSPCLSLPSRGSRSISCIRPLEASGPRHTTAHTPGFSWFICCGLFVCLFSAFSFWWKTCSRMCVTVCNTCCPWWIVLATKTILDVKERWACSEIHAASLFWVMMKNKARDWAQAELQWEGKKNKKSQKMLTCLKHFVCLRKRILCQHCSSCKLSHIWFRIKFWSQFASVSSFSCFILLIFCQQIDSRTIWLGCPEYCSWANTSLCVCDK